ncbi:hypothetical protein [Embleya scabrispora]|uniref:hypothetical protein n=1 Tax=Embleya scabrispora TaxID=159449 RepID=UPI0003685DE5|nr:hypothetical protein [Embleya scabrispora]MYS86715.1 hypothetical protein [Streptomyces sp. SID5474]
MLYGPSIVRDTTATVTTMGSVDDPSPHAERVHDQLCPDVPGYKIDTAARFASGQRNGRSFADSAPEVVIEIVLGAHVPLGLDASSAGVPLPSSPTGARPCERAR